MTISFLPPTPRCSACAEVLVGEEQGYCADCRTKPVHEGFTRLQLSEAFDRVKNPTNWKMPISGMIPASDRDVTRAAIIFYAGCVPVFETPRHKGFAGQLIVTAVGYYSAVGA